VNKLPGIRWTDRPTVAAESLYEVLSDSLDRHRSGLSIIASPRMGLTTALKLCREGFAQERPDLPVVAINRPRRRPLAQQEIWYALYAAMGCNSSQSRDIEEVRRRTIYRLVTLATETKSDQALLIVDRAHDMDFLHLQEVCTLEDALKAEHIRLTVCLAGHLTLQSMPQNLYARAIHEPLKRYFRFVPFHGLRSSDDLATYLQSFDVPTLGETDDQPVSQLCFPDAYADGWRLVQEARGLWPILHEFKAITQDVEMEAAHEVVCGVLEQAFMEGRGAPLPDARTWSHAVQASNLPVWRSMEAGLSRHPKGHRS
jgi:hypothetical protein